MDKRRQGYEAFIAQLKKQWEETEAFQGERLNRMIAKVQAYLEAAGDLTQDNELALEDRRVCEAELGNYDEGRKDEQVGGVLPSCWRSRTPPGPGWRT